MSKRKARERKRKRPCAYCEKPSTSDDHIPPKAIFIGKGHSLIHVRACELHNNARSLIDTQFLEFLAFNSFANPDAHALWSAALKSLMRARRRRSEILQTLTILPDGSGMVLLPADPFAEAIGWYTRGLYWHHFKEVYPKDLPIRVMRLKGSSMDWTGHEYHSVASGQFEYAYLRLDGHPTVSSWKYVFHGIELVHAITDTDRAVSLGLQIKNHYRMP